ncbi:EAL domain-containing protein [Actinoplanes sp. NPDC049316]|uniref:EAL domain-containing protein n=1 Tax=Actinoplanes sp. NPDC049316 TaxID=3154727 RepID=UPI0034439656
MTILQRARSGLPAAVGEGELVRTIVGLAHDLRLATVAEGVETLEQAAVLQTLGCDEGQGWHYGRPAPADRIAALLAGAGPAAEGGGPGTTPSSCADPYPAHR